MKSFRLMMFVAAFAWIFSASNLAAEDGVTPRDPKVSYSGYSIELDQRVDPKTGKRDYTGSYSLDDITCSRFDGKEKTYLQVKVFRSLLNARGESLDIIGEGGGGMTIFHQGINAGNTFSQRGGNAINKDLKPGNYFLSMTITYQLDEGTTKLLDTMIFPFTIAP